MVQCILDALIVDIFSELVAVCLNQDKWFQKI